MLYAYHQFILYILLFAHHRTSPFAINPLNLWFIFNSLFDETI